ncbi:zinc finger protein hangover [Scaptodrosophila lebanonensis]|uniref:Zinc finger protein hangover n=1 Tax=Drosophila lebanonensis TaxID=7225 RepID=A0A6J2TUY7_DROLE|nr:zinc finger protein hangover [Scaptodrosophila lebanonensis]
MASSDKFDPDRVCRVCLCEVDEFYFIYDEAPVEQGANVAQILNECTRYTCERYDKLPHHMCGGCIASAREAYRFKVRAEESYRSLVSMLGRSLQPKNNCTDVSSQTDQVALLPCEMCDSKFLNSIELRMHRNRHHREQSSVANSSSSELKCRVCSNQFTTLRQLRTHLAQEHQQDIFVQHLQCRICQRTFSRRDHLVRHMRTVHSLDEKCRRRKLEAASAVQPEEQHTATSWSHAGGANGGAVALSGDEMESVPFVLNEAACADENADDYQCNTNPISSNDEDANDDDEAKQSLWLHIKPELWLKVEEDNGNVDEGEGVLTSRMKREKKRKGKTKQMASANEDVVGLEGNGDNEGAEAKEEGRANTDMEVKVEAELVKDEPTDGSNIKQERQRTDSEHLEDHMERHTNVAQLTVSDEGVIEDSSDDDSFDEHEENNDDDDEEDVEEEEDADAEMEQLGKPPKVEIVREYLQKSANKQRRRRRNKDEPNPENRCNICERTFSRHCHLLRHKLSHLEKKPHNCPHCPKAFARSDHLKAHVQSLHSNKDHKCTLCNAAFARADALVRHKVSKHNGEGLDAGNELKLHTCEYCAKRFSSKTYLRKHTLLHTDFLYACKSCDETFKERQQLREHEKTHTGQRNFLCCICGDSFARNDYLRVHMRRHNGEKPYKCRFCVKAFPRATDLKVHERYHTGTKPNLCNTCGKSFHRAYNLTIHMRTHTGERPYKCDQCPKSFTQSNDLKAHIRRHTGERYKCPHCDACFLQLYNMRNHCLSAHNKLIETRTGRLQRTGLLDDGSQSHLTTVVLPPARFQHQPQDVAPQVVQVHRQQQQEQLPTTMQLLHSPLSYEGAAVATTSPPVVIAATTTTPVLVDGNQLDVTTSGTSTAAATASLGAFNFMAHLMYNHSGGNQQSQASNASGGNDASK